jgi:hypothetical protein
VRPVILAESLPGGPPTILLTTNPFARLVNAFRSVRHRLLLRCAPTTWIYHHMHSQNRIADGAGLRPRPCSCSRWVMTWHRRAELPTTLRFA